MSALASPLVTDRTAIVVRLNPLVKLAAAVIVMLGLLATTDAVTPGLMLAFELVVVALAGISWRRLLARAWPLFIGVAGLGLTTLIFSTDERPWLAAIAIALRVLAIALPGILAFATTDPTEFADALVQHLRAPARFTFGALAAFRLVPLLGDEWRTLLMARRARGIDAGRNPIRRLRLFGSAVFGLLVSAIRRGVRLAAAMEARGFGAERDRSLARPTSLGALDWVFLAATVTVLSGVTALSIALGTWRPFLWV